MHKKHAKASSLLFNNLILICEQVEMSQIQMENWPGGDTKRGVRWSTHNIKINLFIDLFLY